MKESCDGDDPSLDGITPFNKHGRREIAPAFDPERAVATNTHRGVMSLNRGPGIGRAI